MRKSLWRQFVLLFVLMAIMATTSAWATPGLSPESSSSTSPGIVLLWWNALAEWSGWPAGEVDRESEQTHQAITIESQTPEADPTVWQLDSSADAGPSHDPDG